jgi:aerobic-type carbon monoxide dehydrogenase small subunit (CoxS/CutS family)
MIRALTTLFPTATAPVTIGAFGCDFAVPAASWEDKFMPRVTELRVNGARRRLDAEADRSLLSVLRDDLELTGAKYGCGEGRCGACTVLVDGEAVRSCLARVGAIGERPVTTIEGLEHDGTLHPLQQAMLEAGAMQCGYCTPGMIMSGVGLLAKTPDPDLAEIVRHMDGNICRCGTYPRILAAIRKAAAVARGGAR